MKCPYCKNEMEEGYVPFNSPFILKWVSLVDKKKVRISDKIKWSEVSKIKNILYCKDCNVFIKKIQGSILKFEKNKTVFGLSYFFIKAERCGASFVNQQTFRRLFFHLMLYKRRG